MFKRSASLAAMALFAMPPPAHATLQIAADVNGATSFCADNAACDLNPAVGILQVANGTFNGVQVNGSIQSSGVDFLNTSSLSVINTGLLPRTVTVAISATDFVGPTSSLEFAGAGTWEDAIGSSITLNWFDDPTNTQGAATAFDTPGTLVGTFSNTAGLAVDSFAHDGTSAFANPGAFSLTEQATFTLPRGGELINRGQGIVGSPVPEPSTWAMLVAGFGLLGLVGFRRRKKMSVGAFS